MRQPLLTALLTLMLTSLAHGATTTITGSAEADAMAAKRGKLLFLQCGACHSVIANAPPGVGPTLSGVYGRKSAAVPGFNYSPALKKAALIWDDKTLDSWLQNPNALVPGTTMVIAPIGKAADRQAVIAYLRQVSAATPAIK